jgi:hypothetical protein
MSESTREWARTHPENVSNWNRKYYQNNLEQRKRSVKVAHADFQNATYNFADRHCKSWSPIETRKLRKLSKTKTVKEVAIELGRTYYAIQAKAAQNEIKFGRQWKHYIYDK